MKFDIWEQTDKQTDTLITVLSSRIPTGGIKCSNGHFEGERVGTPFPLLKSCRNAAFPLLNLVSRKAQVLAAERSPPS